MPKGIYQRNQEWYENQQKKVWGNIKRNKKISKKLRARKGDWITDNIRKKMSEAKKGRIPWNKGLDVSDVRVKRNHDKRVKTLRENYQKGKIKVWNKGLTIKDERVRKNVQSAQKVRNTSIEQKVEKMLKIIGLKYQRQKYMKIQHHYNCDFFLPEHNLIIECDGNYWHKYPYGLERDHIRNKEMREKGFKVLRIWGSEIKNMVTADLVQKIKGQIK